MSAGTEIVHPDPVWRDRANFIIGAPLPGEGRSEQLWARQVADTQFEVCCIPFFLYDIALGDIVETDASFAIARVVQRSGRYVFRVWFGESFEPRSSLADELAALGALLEWSSVNLLAVDARDRSHAETIGGFLVDQQDRSGLMFETGRS